MYLFAETSNRKLLDVASGQSKADLVIPQIRLVDVWNSEIYSTGVAIKGNRIAFVGETEHTIGKNTKIVKGQRSYLIPGLMDAHIHIESSKLSILEFAKTVVPNGTTSVFADPIQSSTSIGRSAIELMLEWSEKLPLRVFATVSDGPSDRTKIVRGFRWEQNRCTTKELKQLLRLTRCAGLGETFYRNDVRDKISLTIRQGLPVWGGLAGASIFDLNCNTIVGISNDHDFRQVDEAVARSRLGITVVIVEGSLLRNVDNVVKSVISGKVDAHHCCFATDDKIVSDVMAEGGVDYAVRRSITIGLDPIIAVQMGTTNCARSFGLDRVLGTVTPGKIADLVILKDLERFRVDKVIVDGKVVSANGVLLGDFRCPTYPTTLLNTFPRGRRMNASDLAINCTNRDTVDVLAIQIIEGSIFNRKVHVELHARGSELGSDVDKDLLKIAVIQKFNKKRVPKVGLGFIKGLGVKQGAIAVCEAFRTPSIVVTGVHDSDLALAANRVREIQGGYAVVRDGAILGSLETPLAGVVLFTGDAGKKENREVGRSSSKRTLLRPKTTLHDDFVPGVSWPSFIEIDSRRAVGFCNQRFGPSV